MSLIESIELEFARRQHVDDPHRFVFGPQEYTVRLDDGEYRQVSVGWDTLLADLKELRRPGRDAAVVGRVGTRLRQILDPAGWDRIEGAIKTALSTGRKVQIVIRSAAAEIYALPWEVLTLRSSGETLGSARGVVVRYEWLPLEKRRAERGVRRGRGRILVAWSAAGGAVPAAEHIAAISSACQDAKRDAPEVLCSVTLVGLGQALAEARAEGRPFECLHLLCHGGAVGSAYGLFFDGGDALVEPAQLQRIIADHASALRLVVIAACDGANDGQLGAHVGSVAQMLHRLGVGVVIASRYPLTVGASVLISEALYRSILVKRMAIDEAFIAARKAIEHCAGDEWATLQLLWRGDDVDLWRLWSAATDVEENLRGILGRDEGARALTSVLLRPTYLGNSGRSLPLDEAQVVASVVELLVERSTTCEGLGRVCEIIALAIAELQRPAESVNAACEVIEALAPACLRDLNDACVLAGVDEEFVVSTRGLDALEVVIAQLEDRACALEVRGEDLVGAGLYSEPVIGVSIQKDSRSVAHQIVRTLAEDTKVRVYPQDTIEDVAETLEDHFRLRRARSPEGTPGIEFNPPYLAVSDSSTTITREARREIMRLVGSLRVVVQRTDRKSALDRAMVALLGLFRLRRRDERGGG